MKSDYKHLNLKKSFRVRTPITVYLQRQENKQRQVNLTGKRNKWKDSFLPIKENKTYQIASLVSNLQLISTFAFTNTHFVFPKSGQKRSALFMHEDGYSLTIVLKLLLHSLWFYWFEQMPVEMNRFALSVLQWASCTVCNRWASVLVHSSVLILANGCKLGPSALWSSGRAAIILMGLVIWLTALTNVSLIPSMTHYSACPSLSVVLCLCVFLQGLIDYIQSTVNLLVSFHHFAPYFCPFLLNFGANVRSSLHPSAVARVAKRRSDNVVLQWWHH